MDFQTSSTELITKHSSLLNHNTDLHLVHDI